MAFLNPGININVSVCSVTGLYTCIHMIILTLLYLYGVVRMRLLNHSLVYTRLHHMVSGSELSGTMASYNASLSPPAAFPFNTPDLWPKWKHHFEHYRVASRLSKEAEERQVNTLLYCLGEEARRYSGANQYLRRPQKAI